MSDDAYLCGKCARQAEFNAAMTFNGVVRDKRPTAQHIKEHYARFDTRDEMNASDHCCVCAQLAGNGCYHVSGPHLCAKHRNHWIQRVLQERFSVAQRGWICPVCGRANAPHVEYCGAHHGENIAIPPYLKETKENV